jgi:hypothetical protein
MRSGRREAASSEAFAHSTTRPAGIASFADKLFGTPGRLSDRCDHLFEPTVALARCDQSFAASIWICLSICEIYQPGRVIKQRNQYSQSMVVSTVNLCSFESFLLHLFVFQEASTLTELKVQMDIY